MIKDVENEIRRRKELLQKANNRTITAEEQLWLITHPIYNQQRNDFSLNTSVEHFLPNKWYVFKIKVESVNYNGRIVPQIFVPDKKGKLKTDLILKNYKGEFVSKKSVRMIAFEPDNDSLEYTVEVFSTVGCLSVDYCCDYFDEKHCLHMRKASATGDPNFAMIREFLGEQTVRYYCKSPVVDSFDALVFSLKWMEK